MEADTRKGANVQLRIRGARGLEAVLTADNELERGAPFCDNPRCALPVRLQDLHVEGGGNWVALPDGRTFGRSRCGSTLPCDACGTRRGPLRLAPLRSTN